jgi:heme-degrading monooxygenase HmoA
MNAGEVVVFVQLRIQPENREQFLEALSEVIERSRIAPGCLCYELFGRIDDENTLLLLQTWDTREAFETNWLYIDLPRLNTNSHLLATAIEFQELQLLL